MSSNAIAGGYAPTPERLQYLEAKAYKPASMEFALPPEVALNLQKKQAYIDAMGKTLKDTVKNSTLDKIAKGQLPLVQETLINRFYSE